MRKFLITTFIFFTASLIIFNESQAKSYSDVPTTHWGYEAIEKATEEGYVDGTGDGTFKPNNTVTHAEFLKMLVVALDLPYVIEGKWYEGFVKSALSNQLINSNEKTSIKWELPMSRQDVAKRGMIGLGNDNTDDKKWMYLAASNGLIKGTDSKGTINENGTLTRAEAVVIIDRIKKIKNGEQLPTDKRAIANAEIIWHQTNIFTMLPDLFDINLEDPLVNIDTLRDEVLVYKSEDGNYINRLEPLIVIDLSDQNDPNRHLINGYYIDYHPDLYGNSPYSGLQPLPNIGYAIMSFGELEVINNIENYKFLYGAVIDTHLPQEGRDGKNSGMVVSNKDIDISHMTKIDLLEGKDGAGVYKYSFGRYIIDGKRIEKTPNMWRSSGIHINLPEFLKRNTPVVYHSGHIY